MKKLYLSKTDRKLLGVCGGMAEYLNVDSTAVRLIWIILAVVTAFLPFVLIYLLAFLIIPDQPPVS